MASDTAGSRGLNHVIMVWPVFHLLSPSSRLISGLQQLQAGSILTTCSPCKKALAFIPAFLCLICLLSSGMVTCPFLKQSLWPGESEVLLAEGSAVCPALEPGRKSALTWSTRVSLGKREFSRRKLRYCSQEWTGKKNCGSQRSSNISLPSLCRALSGRQTDTKMNMTQSFPTEEFRLLLENQRCLAKGKQNETGKHMWLQQPGWWLTHPVHHPVSGDSWGFWPFASTRDCLSPGSKSSSVSPSLTVYFKAKLQSHQFSNSSLGFLLQFLSRWPAVVLGSQSQTWRWSSMNKEETGREVVGSQVDGGKRGNTPSPDGSVCKEVVAIFNLPQMRRLRPRERTWLIQDHTSHKGQDGGQAWVFRLQS